MPISVKDIREKKFSYQKKDGYNVDEVDDFLDEIVDQLSVLIRENMALSEQVKTLEAQAEKGGALFSEAVAAPVKEEPAKEAEPAYDEPSYFKNLEIAMRDTLINAQRIADDTVAEARAKAQELVKSAEEQASATLANAKTEADGIKAEADNVRKAIANYRASFRHLVEGQVQILKETDSLFD